MIRKFIAAFALMFFVMSSTALAVKPVKVYVKPGEVYRETGLAVINKENSHGSIIFDKTYARQLARMNARLAVDLAQS